MPPSPPTRYEEMVSCIPQILECWDDLSRSARKAAKDFVGRIVELRAKLEEFGEGHSADVIRADEDLRGYAKKIKKKMGVDAIGMQVDGRVDAKG